MEIECLQLAGISKRIRKLIPRVLSPSKCGKKTPFPHFNVEPPSEPAGISTLGCMKMYVRFLRIVADCCMDNPAPPMCTLRPTHIHLSCLVSGITRYRMSTVDAELHTAVPPMRSKRHSCHHFSDNQCLQAPTQKSRSSLDPCSLVLCLDKWGTISNTTNSTISTQNRTTAAELDQINVSSEGYAIVTTLMLLDKYTTVAVTAPSIHN